MDVNEKSGTQVNQSAEKMLVIIEYLALHGEPVRLLDISKDLKMNISTALRFLLTLVKKGYAAQEADTARYYLTYKLCALANKIDRNMDIRMIARPYMEQLTKIFGESTNLAVEENKKAVYVEVLKGSEQVLMSVQRIGNAVPMHCTGNGKLLLLNASEEELDQYIQTEGLPRFTEHTLTSKWQLQEELKKIRQRGYAYDEEEREIGARCLAFPIYDSFGRVIAGMSVTGPANRLTDSFIEPRLEDFRTMSLEISAKMGYRAFD